MLQASSTFPRQAMAALAIACALITGCSDGADSSELDVADECLVPAGPVTLTETPPAPPAACTVPPSAIGRAIDVQLGQQLDPADERRAELLDPSRLTVITCGTGSPIPSARAQSCLAVFVNGQFLLFDAGDGAQESMENLNLPVADLDAVFVTHFHSDHIADLGEVISRSWIFGRSKRITVYAGREGVQVVGGFNAVYLADDKYRVAHHGADLFPDVLAADNFTILDPGAEGSVVYESDGVVVKAFEVDHSPVGTALGYRVEYAGLAVGISGDTIATPGLSALAANADILVAEAMNKAVIEEFECAFGRRPAPRNEKIFRDIRTYHIDLPELATLARDAAVPTLVLTHLVPAFDAEAQLDLFFRRPVQAIYDGELIVAADGTEIVRNLP